MARQVQMGVVTRALGTEIVSDGKFDREINRAFMSYARMVLRSLWFSPALFDQS